MWFSVVCTFIGNDMHHHSGQNVVDSVGWASWVHKQTMLNHTGFVTIIIVFKLLNILMDSVLSRFSWKYFRATRRDTSS